MGDRILKVNEADVSKATHQDAVLELLKPGDEIKLTIQHDPLPPGFQVSLVGKGLWYSVFFLVRSLVRFATYFLFSFCCKYICNFFVNIVTELKAF